MFEIDIRKIPVYWINLAKDVKRRKSMSLFFRRHNFKQAIRIPGVVHAEQHVMSHYIGCMEAHRAAFEAAPADDFIIMEDDCAPTKWFSPILRMPLNTDGFYLGVSLWGAKSFTETCPYLKAAPVEKQHLDEGVCKITNMLSTHAIYYRTARYARVCKALIDKARMLNIPHDITYALNMRNCNVYCKRRPLFYQRSSAEITNVEW